MAVESGEDGAIVSELAGHSDTKTLEVYKKIRNRRLHEASRRVAQTVERVGRNGVADPLAFREEKADGFAEGETPSADESSRTRP